ncbi:MAG: FAD-dependent monooxygenase [Thermoflexibacter sp.]|jgi:uncharacterized FAD-dependent dehydrogenase|nr:FAD-dependent monooxygenase [Thermoflexibacter sp.]
MRKQLSIVLPPEIAFEKEKFEEFVKQQQKLQDFDNLYIRQVRRSIDARSKQVKVNVNAEIFIDEFPSERISYQKNYPDVSKAMQAIIVGAGPAGMFAALRLIELGVKPIVLERGSDVRARRRDLAAINKAHIVNPESNYCFGEGGAGTYSDGKLYTRSTKRGDFQRILEIFVAHGASEEILIDAHPHIGTNKLPAIVTEIRQSILNAGGEIHFDTKVIDFIIKNGEMRGVKLHNEVIIEGIGVILATGHSARDIFELLQQKNIYAEAKPFALGVRIEHPQQVIDKIQYHCENRGDYLPASSYSLVSQVDYKGIEKGVFSFCMCPGGFIVPSATAQGEVVVNGMSPSRRNSKFANSGIVVAVDESDWKFFEKSGILAGMEFQKSIEQKACKIAGNTQNAPAQRMIDFVNRKVSSSLPETSYQPGLTSLLIDEVLPPQISQRLRKGFQDFGKKMKGYLTNEAVIVGVESRTSSPVRIPRNKETYEHVQIKRFFPCGEGAGFAGGIASAAMDGERCAEMLVNGYGKNKS